jgi:hypothetical protein
LDETNTKDKEKKHFQTLLEKPLENGNIGWVQ